MLGGIIAFNKAVDKETAEELSKLFVECIIAPDYSQEALDILMQKKNIRLLKQGIPYKTQDNETEYRMMTSGMLLQDRDNLLLSDIKNMTKREPTEKEVASLVFAWKVCKHVKSNAIILVRGTQTVGVGAGQMSRIDSLNIAAKKMSEAQFDIDENEFPLVMASDAFFPFPDVVMESARIGVMASYSPAVL